MFLRKQGSIEPRNARAYDDVVVIAHDSLRKVLRYDALAGRACYLMASIRSKAALAQWATMSSTLT